MLRNCQRQRAVLGSGPVNHADVLVSLRDAMDIQEPGSDERSRARLGGWRSLAEQFDLESAFLLGFAQSGLLRIFIQFDMSPKRQPLFELPMVNHENLLLKNDKYRDCEIDFFVNVSHQQILSGTVNFTNIRFPGQEAAKRLRLQHYNVNNV